jgi:hypothetical protein
VPPRDQRDLMERPFFSLAKAKSVTRSSTRQKTRKCRFTPFPSMSLDPSGPATALIS